TATTSPAGRRDPAGARTPGPTPAPAAQPLRRPRLPLAREPRRAAPPPHPGEDRLAEERPRLRARDEAMGRRAHDRLAASIPAAAHPLRAPRRHPRSLPRDRLQPYLPQAPSGRRLILKGALSVRTLKLAWLRGTFLLAPAVSATSSPHH